MLATASQGSWFAAGTASGAVHLFESSSSAGGGRPQPLSSFRWVVFKAFASSTAVLSYCVLVIRHTRFTLAYRHMSWPILCAVRLAGPTRYLPAAPCPPRPPPPPCKCTTTAPRRCWSRAAAPRCGCGACAALRSRWRRCRCCRTCRTAAVPAPAGALLGGRGWPWHPTAARRRWCWAAAGRRCTWWTCRWGGDGVGAPRQGWTGRWTGRTQCQYLAIVSAPAGYVCSCQSTPALTV